MAVDDIGVSVPVATSDGCGIRKMRVAGVERIMDVLDRVGVVSGP